jgi:hypothetical protein
MRAIMMRLSSSGAASRRETVRDYGYQAMTGMFMLTMGRV